MTAPHRSEKQGREGVRGVYAREEDRVAAGSMGLLLLLITLGMLFGALVLVVLAVRLNDAAWPKDLPSLPWQTWISTVAIVGVSVALMKAVASMRRGSDAGVRTGLGIAGVLVIIFTCMQVWAWLSWYDAMPQWAAATQSHRIGVMGFWVFTAVHITHVLGGMVPLGMVGWYAVCRSWTVSRQGLLHHTAIYWHFLDAVWVMLLLTMLLVL
ncbi:MAG: cytochrome c oxidase subunit 3 [Phycisphaerales bacterium]|nr:cytochrome c oxidase subunit 3 [Phycisphaerales bacterium]